MDFAVRADDRVKLKESEKMDEMLRKSTFLFEEEEEEKEKEEEEEEEEEEESYSKDVHS